jgi:hypothetical protein
LRKMWRLAGTRASSLTDRAAPSRVARSAVRPVPAHRERARPAHPDHRRRGDDEHQSLLTWPVDEGTLRFIAVVITGVVTSVIVRGLFAAVDF